MPTYFHGERPVAEERSRGSGRGRRGHCRAPQQDSRPARIVGMHVFHFCVQGTLMGIKELHSFEWSYQYVGITYFHGQSPGNYRRRTCA